MLIRSALATTSAFVSTSMPMSMSLVGPLVSTAAAAMAASSVHADAHASNWNTFARMTPYSPPSSKVSSSSQSSTRLLAFSSERSGRIEHANDDLQKKRHLSAQKFRKRLFKFVFFAASSLIMFTIATNIGGTGGVANAAVSSQPSKTPHFLTRQGTLDVGRAKMRLEGLQSYGTISALSMNTCIKLYTSIKEPKDATKSVYTPHAKLHRRIYTAFMLFCLLSIAFGSYTTIVFTMISLFSKQALGRGLDDGFLQFYDATHVFRDSGFRAFLYSLIGFQGAFILSLVMKMDAGAWVSSEDDHGATPADLKAEQKQLAKFLKQRKWILVGIAAGTCLLSIARWSTVMALASKYIYSVAY